MRRFLAQFVSCFALLAFRPLVAQVAAPTASPDVKGVGGALELLR